MPLTRAELMARFDDLGIESRTKDHPPIMTVDEGREHWHDMPGVHAKNLFLKDAKDRLWLVTVPADRAIDLKTLPERIGSKRVSFGKAELLMEVLGVAPGSVTPLSVVNDTEGRVTLVLDAWMMTQDIVNVHPLTNAATTALSPADLLRFVRATGHEPVIVEFD